MKKIWIIAGMLFFLTGCSLQNSTEKEVPPVSEQTSQQSSIQDNTLPQLSLDEIEITDEQITRETIHIEGLQKDYDFLFLTDTHINVPDQSYAKELQEYVDQRNPMFVDEYGLTSADTLPKWLDYAVTRQVDGVLLGGDIIDCPSDANITFLGQQLNRLPMPYLYTPGNHDWTFPWEYMTSYGKETYLTKLEPWMSSNADLHSLDLDELIIVAVNDSSNQIPSGILEEYQRILDLGKPVIVLLHVPLLTQSLLEEARKVWKNAVVLGGGNYGGILPDENSQKFIDLTTSKDSPVKAVLAGHVHFYNRDSINEHIVQIVGDAGFHGQGIMLHITGKNE